LNQHATGHITRTIIFDKEGEKLYLSVGSNSNVNTGEPPIRAAISRYNPDGTGHELFATEITEYNITTFFFPLRALWAFDIVFDVILE